MQMHVLGIKHVKGSFTKEGTGEVIDYDYIAVHVVLPLQGDDKARGSSSAIIRMNDSKQWDNIKDHKYPGVFELNIRMVGDGKGGFRQECTGLTPIKAAA